MPFSSEGSNTNKASPPSLYLIGGWEKGEEKKEIEIYLKQTCKDTIFQFLLMFLLMFPYKQPQEKMKIQREKRRQTS